MTSLLRKVLRIKNKAMYPSLDSWTLTDLENRLNLLNNVAFWLVIVVTLIGLFGGIWWDGYKDRINEQIEKLKADTRAKEEAAIKADVAEAKKLIPGTTGVLTPGDGPMPEIPARSIDFSVPIPGALDQDPEKLKALEALAKEHEATGAYIFLGKFVNIVGHLPFLAVVEGDEDILRIDKEEGGISVSGRFFNEKGKVICEIERNQFHLNPESYFRKKETGPHRLTIIDDKLRTLLDVEYINDRAIRITGDFYLRGGKRLVIMSCLRRNWNFPSWALA
jgi:hypothetical protein